MEDARNKIQYLTNISDEQQRLNSDIEINHKKERETYMNQNEELKEKIKSLEQKVIHINIFK